MTQCIDLNDQLDLDTMLFAQLNQFIKKHLPVAIAGKIIIGNEKSLDALGNINAHNAFKIICRAEPALAPLHINDGAKRALKRAAASKVKTGPAALGARHHFNRQERYRFAIN